MEVAEAPPRGKTLDLFFFFFFPTMRWFGNSRSVKRVAPLAKMGGPFLFLFFNFFKILN
jgi:hypothetical protein